MKLRHLPIFLLLTLVVIQNTSAQTEKLRKKIGQIMLKAKGKVGVAIVGLDFGDTLSINGNQSFPMQSVYKFPLSMAVLSLVDKGKFKIDQPIHVARRELLPNTWSPLRDKYPRGNVDITLQEILFQTVSYSDNNGCDILFRLIGGPKKADAYLRSIGVKKIAIANTEKEMQKNWNLQFANSSTPNAMVHLLEILYYRNKLSKSSNDFLTSWMEKTTTGPKRLKGLLPEGAVVAHKTGSSGQKNGITAATNDVGIITLPNGKHFAVVVFVSNTKESEEVQESVIAQISKACWDYFEGMD